MSMLHKRVLPHRNMTTRLPSSRMSFLSLSADAVTQRNFTADYSHDGLSAIRCRLSPIELIGLTASKYYFLPRA
jgi:hypothetical protein